MRKLEVADPAMMRMAIQDEIARSGEARYDHRLHGVLLVSQGMNCYEVARWLGEHPVTVQRWVKRFNAHGFAGLREGERPGRPPRLTPEQWQPLAIDLRQSPRGLGYPQNLWDGRLLAHHVAQRHGVRLGVRQCQRLFRQMGFRRRKPRPRIAHADLAAQEAYKKTAPSGLRRRR